MSSSYKQCYRRNVVLKHAHAKQSSSLDTRRTSVSRSIDSDLNKLQQQLNTYKKRRSEWQSSATLSAYSNSGCLSAQKRLLLGSEDGDLIRSAPDITQLYTPDTADSTPKVTFPGPKLRIYSACSEKRRREDEKRQSPSRDGLRYGVPQSLDLDTRRNSAAPPDIRRQSTSPLEDRRHSTIPNYRRLLQSPHLLRRRSDSPERAETWSPARSPTWSPARLNKRLSISNISLQSLQSLPASPTTSDYTPSSGDDERRSAKSASPRSVSPMIKHNEEVSPTSGQSPTTKPKFTRQRSKSLDLGIRTVDDITTFFNGLKMDRRGTAKKRLTSQGKHGKRHSLPELERKKKTRGRGFLPALVITCAEE